MKSLEQRAGDIKWFPNKLARLGQCASQAIFCPSTHLGLGVEMLTHLKGASRATHDFLIPQGLSSILVMFFGTLSYSNVLPMALRTVINADTNQNNQDDCDVEIISAGVKVRVWYF